MAINIEHMASKNRAYSAIQMQKRLISLGVSQDQFILGGRGESYAGYTIGVFSDETHNNHYWVKLYSEIIEYFLQPPSIDFSPIAILFFTDDFHISMDTALDETASLNHVKSIIMDVSAIKLCQVNFNNGTPPDEGYFIRQTNDSFDIYYAERGNQRLLGSTPYPWIAGLTIAWFKNYKALS